MHCYYSPQWHTHDTVHLETGWEFRTSLFDLRSRHSVRIESTIVWFWALDSGWEFSLELRCCEEYGEGGSVLSTKWHVKELKAIFRYRSEFVPSYGGNWNEAHVEDLEESEHKDLDNWKMEVQENEEDNGGNWKI